MMPPKAKTPSDTGLLEYLEEIIGSVRVRPPICLRLPLPSRIASAQRRI